MTQLPFNIPGTGTLALVGSGEYLERMDPVDQALLARLDGPARVACLPTAAGTEGAQRIAYWSNLGRKHFQALGAAEVDAVEVIDRAGAEDAALAERVRRANFVYLSGGRPSYLYATLAGSLVWKAICSVLERGGVVAGCSAGAMIFAARIPGFRLIHPLSDGFGFLPGTVVMPHFNELPGAIAAGLPALLGDLMLVGVEGYTALACRQDGWQVLGSGRVLLAQGSQKRWLSAADGEQRPEDFRL